MFKTLAKWLMPAPEKLAAKAADRIQTAYNSVDPNRRETVAKYADRAETINAYAQRVNAILKDGTISDAERDEIAKVVAVIINEAEKIVFED